MPAIRYDGDDERLTGQENEGAPLRLVYAGLTRTVHLTDIVHDRVGEQDVDVRVYDSDPRGVCRHCSECKAVRISNGDYICTQPSSTGPTLRLCP